MVYFFNKKIFLFYFTFFFFFLNLFCKDNKFDFILVPSVRCGPGTFICEMAADYPKSYYVGVDLISAYPSTRPHNVNFIQCDLLKGLPFKENTFDFVYVRYL